MGLPLARERQQADIGGTPTIATVVVVDDHPLVRGMLRMACEERGLLVVAEAGDGVEAIDACLRLDPDVVVLDLILPRMSGFEVARRLRQEGSAARILILTGSDEPRSMLEAFRLGVSGYLEKTAPLEEIAAAVEAVASGASVFDPEHERRAREQLRELARAASTLARVSARLSPRVREVLELMAEGLTNRQIAFRLGISPSTVQGYVAGLYRDLDARGRVQAIRRAYAMGLLERVPAEGPEMRAVGP